MTETPLTGDDTEALKGQQVLTEGGICMNKEELVSAVAEKTQLSKKASEEIVSAFVDTITETLEKGDKVTLVGFGTFQVKERAARTGRNPRTGGELNIPAKRSPTFTAGKGLKDSLGG
jgi:DNA-binding protein HU-beta